MTQIISDSLHTPPVQRHVLHNGMILMVTENPVADIVSAHIFLRAGSAYEKPEQAGISHLMATVMTKGTHRLSSLEIAEKVESAGARFGADSTPDYFLISLKTVSADFPEILQLAGEVMRSPSFPESEVELERRVTIQGIRSQQEQPFAVAFAQMRHILYKDHPYAFSTLGIEATVSELTATDLQEFHQTYFRPDNIIISIAGRITDSLAREIVEEVFGDWQAPALPLPSLNLPAIPRRPVKAVSPQETQQSIVMLGYLSPPVHDPDYATMKLINTYLGNGLSSRLFVELREKQGLAYDVSAFYPTRLDLSSFVVYIGTAPDNTAIALAGLRSEIQRLVEQPLSEEEIETAKNKILGQYALGKQTNSQIAQVYGWYETIGVGIDFDQKFIRDTSLVTVEDVLAAANSYLREPYLSMVGPYDAVSNYLY